MSQSLLLSNLHCQHLTEYTGPGSARSIARELAGLSSYSGTNTAMMKFRKLGLIKLFFSQRKRERDIRGLTELVHICVYT